MEHEIFFQPPDMAICAHNFFLEIKSHALCQILPKERQFRHAYSGTICPCKEARKHMSSLEWSPLHIAAEQGSLEGCYYIIEKTVIEILSFLYFCQRSGDPISMKFGKNVASFMKYSFML